MTLNWWYGENTFQTWEHVTVDNHRVTVYDCDGDFSYFEVVQLKPRDTVHRSCDFTFGPRDEYHFDIAHKAAEDWIREHLRS